MNESLLYLEAGVQIQVPCPFLRGVLVVAYGVAVVRPLGNNLTQSILVWIDFFRGSLQQPVLQL